MGDCAIPEAAEIVGAAMVAHENKRGKKAWTYTHAWRRIARAAWQGARVLASCHKSSEVEQAMDRGYAVALTIGPLQSNKAYMVARDERGNPIKPFEVIPCPAQFKREDGRRYTTCETCSICQDVDKLYDRRRVVGFQPDGTTANKVIPLTLA